MNVMVSVIVPVYNSQKFLGQCIESILGQTYTNFELILINDGSTDQSGVICEEYAKLDARIKVFHQENKGAAVARNQGILISEGKYLMFCDSDDIVSSMWIERLINLMDDEDIFPIGAFCYHVEELGLGKQLSFASEKKVKISDYYYFNQSGIAGFVCNALYCRNIVVENHIMFREEHSNGDFNEDLIFSLTYVQKVAKLIYTGYADYMYNVHTDSLSQRYKQYYFDKYKEKYKLWSQFISSFCSIDERKNQVELATKFLYHVMVSLQMDINQSEIGSWKKYYCHFKKIIHSSEVRECLRVADTSKENTFVVFAMRHNLCIMLWIFYMLEKLKHLFKVRDLKKE